VVRSPRPPCATWPSAAQTGQKTEETVGAKSMDRDEQGTEDRVIEKPECAAQREGT